MRNTIIKLTFQEYFFIGQELVDLELERRVERA